MNKQFEIELIAIPHLKGYGFMPDLNSSTFFCGVHLHDWMRIAYNKLSERGITKIKHLELISEFTEDGGYVERLGSKIPTGAQVIIAKGECE